MDAPVALPADVIVAIDAMGGDHGPAITVPAALSVLERDPRLQVILVGQPDPIHAQLSRSRSSVRARVQVEAASELIAMDEAPATAMRNKKDSSMRVAIDLVKSGKAHAAVSAGNTGALMAISRFVLKTLPGIDRPAICTVLPTLKGQAYVLDLGANVDCAAEHLLQFALMGAMLAAAVEDIPRPSIGLLNIGAEAIKGNDIVKQAAELLRNSHLNFFGNIEGDDIYKGTTDVVVCDGFVGNVALKTSEGLAQMLGTFLKQEFQRNFFSKIAAGIAWPILTRFKRRVDHRRYNGASLLGLRGIVIKSHGSADAFAFEFALLRAVEECRRNVLGRIAEQIAVEHLQVAV